MKRFAITFALAALTLAALGLSHAFEAGQNTVYLPLVACPGCTGTTVVQPSPTPVPPTPTPDLSANVSRMVELVNQARAAVGCPAVVPKAALMQGAQDWSTHMGNTGDYRHAPPNYYQNTYGYPGGNLENIAAAETPDYAFEGWMLSATHKRNIEYCYPTSDPSYDPARIYEVGVGFYNNYWTLVIGWRIP